MPYLIKMINDKYDRVPGNFLPDYLGWEVNSLDPIETFEHAMHIAHDIRHGWKVPCWIEECPSDADLTNMYRISPTFVQTEFYNAQGQYIGSKPPV